MDNLMFFLNNVCWSCLMSYLAPKRHSHRHIPRNFWLCLCNTIQALQQNPKVLGLLWRQQGSSHSPSWSDAFQSWTGAWNQGMIIALWQAYMFISNSMLLTASRTFGTYGDVLQYRWAIFLRPRPNLGFILGHFRAPSNGLVWMCVDKCHMAHGTAGVAESQKGWWFHHGIRLRRPPDEHKTVLHNFTNVFFMFSPCMDYHETIRTHLQFGYCSLWSSRSPLATCSESLL